MVADDGTMGSNSVTPWAIGPRRRRWVVAAGLVAATTTLVSTHSAGAAAPDDTNPPPPTTPAPTTTEPAPTTTAPVPATTAPVPATTGGPTTTQPATSTTAPRPAPLGQTVFPEQIAHILATIRYMESRGIYTLPPNRGNASGAYQFIESTWANFGGFQHAYLAPPAVQDQRAAQDVSRFLAQWNNDVSMIPVMWYYPLAASRPELMDVVPAPNAGNVLTIREYQQRWLGVFATISGQPVAPINTDITLTPVVGGPPDVPSRPDGVPSLSFPVLGPAQLAVPDCDDELGADSAAARSGIEGAGLCTSEAPAIIFGAQLQPVLAATDGVVTEVIDEPDHPVSLTVTNTDGRSYVYSGFNNDSPGVDDDAAPPHLRLSGLARLGTTVRAGQVLGFMGSTDPLPSDAGLADGAAPTPGTPHLRLTIYDLDGRALDSYGPVIDALYRQTCTLAMGPWSVPPNGEGHNSLVVESIDADPEIDSEWVITPQGQVTAAGWAALINPQDSCEDVPAEHHGPDAEGPTTVPNAWLAPLDLPTTMWVTLAVQTADTAPEQFLRRS